MKLLGHYLSPFTRRVAVSLHALDIPFALEELSVIQEPALLGGPILYLPDKETVKRNFHYGPPTGAASTEPPAPFGQLVNASQDTDRSHAGDPCRCAVPCFRVWSLRPCHEETPRPGRASMLHGPRSGCRTPAQVGCRASRSMRPRIWPKRRRVK